MEGEASSKVDKRVTNSAATRTGFGEIELCLCIEDFFVEADEKVHIACEHR